MDDALRLLERRARVTQAPADFLALAAARVRGGQKPRLREHDLVKGAGLGALLLSALGDRREVEVARAAGASEKKLGITIAAFRLVTRGKAVRWVRVARWAEWLGIEPALLAALVES